MWPYPRVIAHRGGGTLAPENTLAGLRCGLEHGFRAVEFDAMLAADGVPVLMHDPALGRTVAGHGDVAAFTSSQLQAMDAGAWFSERFRGEPVCTLAGAIRFCRANDIWMNIEIKPFSKKVAAETGRVVAEVVAREFSDVLVDASGYPDKLPLFSSFEFDALKAAAKAAPLIPRGFLMDEVVKDWYALLQDLDAIALHTNHKKLTHKLAETIKGGGFGLLCYTVNKLARAEELVSWGVDAICTDKIDQISAQAF